MYNDWSTWTLAAAVPAHASQPSRNILLHDFFEICGGGERLSLVLSKGLGLDLCYGFWTPESYDASERDDLTTFDLGAYSSLAGWRTLKQMMAFRRKTRFIRDYDKVIYSGVGSPLAVHNHPHGQNIFYCHTPPRFIYDQHEFYLTQLPKWQQPLLQALVATVKPMYESAVEQMDVIVANSTNVQRRIKRYLGKDAQVVYPPADTKRFAWRGQHGYYLSTARLDRLKRVELVIRAFMQMPTRRLIVASGGSESERLQEIARGAPNIGFTGWVSDRRLRSLLGGAIATLYVPRDEDFGMSPVESMAAGKPVIAAGSGGLQETVVDGETGTLLPPDPSVDEIVEAVEDLPPERALSMRQACEARSREFSTEMFLERMGAVVND